MKSYLTILLTVYALGINAQSIQQKLFGGKNRVEIGTTGMHFFSQKISKSHKPTTDKIYIGYSRIFNSNNIISLDYIEFSGGFNNWKIGDIIGTYAESFTVSYGRIFNYSSIEIIPSLGLSYRYDGLEFISFAERNPGLPWSEPIFAILRYNSIGIKGGFDLNYFFAKNMGLGAKFSYANYPFEKARFATGGIDEPSQECKDTHLPLNQMIILNLKLIGRF